MPKYWRDPRDDRGIVYTMKHPGMTEVTVIPTADWRRLVDILQNIEIISTSDNGGWDEAQAIIAKVEADND